MGEGVLLICVYSGQGSPGRMGRKEERRERERVERQHCYIPSMHASS